MANTTYKDWGEISEKFDLIKSEAFNKALNNESEAQTRFDVIDRVIREILQWNFGQISVEEYSKGQAKEGYIDYLLKCGDYKIVIEAKKVGASFPSPSKRKKLKLTGSILIDGEIGDAISQAEKYAKDKEANVVIVTNGNCWCFYAIDETIDRNDIYAYILFPFGDVEDAEQLFDFFAIFNVEKDSLLKLSSENPYVVVHSLINETKDADARIGRNSVADHIAPALDYAFHGESLIGEEEKLKFCFVNTDARTKYDNTLRIFLADRKPEYEITAKRIKKEKQSDELQQVLKGNSGTVPVTLLIGPVGAGKSTYLSHFELVQARELLGEKKAFWVYIDFEKMGSTGNPRNFIYDYLKSFSLNEHPHVGTDFKSLIEPAYEDEIKKLARGPFGITAKNKEKFEEKIQEIIASDFEKGEPYVEKIFSYIAKTHLCVIVLDNIDLYENSDLEIKVFSEGIALSKKIGCNIIVSIRDTTYVKHKNESIFNAFELKRFWIDPPPFKEVLSKRLKFASHVLKGKKASVLFNSIKLKIEDLSIFFDIAHSTLLQERSFRLIECLADGNIRTGITLVSNFLTSAHIQADRALYNYISNNVVKSLPFHEVFKGAVLGPWKYYKEERAEALNILNAGFNSRTLQFLRAYVIKMLFFRAKDKNTIETPFNRISETFSHIGATDNHILKVLDDLNKNHLIKTIDSRPVDINSVVSITLTGGYYYNNLLKQFEYLESILVDTPIFLEEAWESIYFLSEEIVDEENVYERVIKRKERILVFHEYIKAIEKEGILNTSVNTFSIGREIEGPLNRKLTYILANAKEFYK